MTYDTLLYTLTGNIATITLNRPGVRNGLNTQMRLDLMHALRRAPDEARAIVITGAGEAFCSGQDLTEQGVLTDIDIERTLREEYEPLLRLIYDCPVPTLSAVNGAAAGAGANLALAADIVIATHSAYFVQAFARIGLIPDAGGTYWMPRQMGIAKAMGAALFAEKITAAEADAWGLIWEAIPDDAFGAHVAQRAAHLAKGPTATYARIKRALREGLDNPLSSQLALEAELQGEAGHTRDFLEGVLAFTEKRAPKFEGR